MEYSSIFSASLINLLQESPYGDVPAKIWFLSEGFLFFGDLFSGNPFVNCYVTFLGIWIPRERTLVLKNKELINLYTREFFSDLSKQNIKVKCDFEPE